MQLSLENTHQFPFQRLANLTCALSHKLKATRLHVTPFLGSKKELLGQSGCVRHPRLFIMVGVYSPTLYKNWGVEWESLFSQPLFHGMPEGFEHCSSGYIGKICSGLCSQMVYWRTIGVWMGLAYTRHVSCNLKTYGK